MAEKTNANIGFEKQLWDAACVLWGAYTGSGIQKGNHRAYLFALHFCSL